MRNHNYDLEALPLSEVSLHVICKYLGPFYMPLKVMCMSLSKQTTSMLEIHACHGFCMPVSVYVAIIIAISVTFVVLCA